MIQRIGRGRGSSNSGDTAEGNVNFLGIDWDRIAKEAAATDAKYNGPKKQEPLRVSQTNRGNMYSQKNQHRISFLENDVPTPVQKEAETVEKSLPSRMSSNGSISSDHLQSSRAVARLSSVDGDGSVSNFGGPSRYMKSETAPSIWDSGKLQRAAQQMADSRKSIHEEKEAQQQYRRSVRQQALDNLVEGLASVDTRKASHVSTASDQTVPSEVSDQVRYTRETRNISIFDSMENQKDFARLNSMTAGERLSARKKAEREQRDQSWRDGGRSVNTKQYVSNLFDMLSNQEK